MKCEFFALIVSLFSKFNGEKLLYVSARLDSVQKWENVIIQR